MHAHCACVRKAAIAWMHPANIANDKLNVTYDACSHACMQRMCISHMASVCATVSCDAQLNRMHMVKKNAMRHRRVRAEVLAGPSELGTVVRCRIDYIASSRSRLQRMLCIDRSHNNDAELRAVARARMLLLLLCLYYSSFVSVHVTHHLLLARSIMLSARGYTATATMCFPGQGAQHSSAAHMISVASI